MSTAWVECCKCDECGHRWIKSEIWPDRCASSKCRKRSWNKLGQSGQASAPAANKPVAPPPEDKPTVPFLPAVKMNNAMAAFVAKLPPVAPIVLAEPEVEQRSCVECDRTMASKYIKGRGMVYACPDQSCPLYGLER